VEWFKWCDPSDLRVDDMVISWDTVMKATELSDYSVGTVWGVRGDLYYLLDLVRVRLDFPALKCMVIEVYDRWTSQQKPTILIEDAGSGTDLIQELYGHDDVPAVARSVARRSQIGAVGLPPWSPRRSGRFDLAGAELAFPATITTAVHPDLIRRRSFAQARAATDVAKFGLWIQSILTKAPRARIAVELGRMRLPI
jgi:hypothetical protein